MKTVRIMSDIFLMLIHCCATIFFFFVRKRTEIAAHGAKQRGAYNSDGGHSEVDVAMRREPALAIAQPRASRAWQVCRRLLFFQMFVNL